MVEDRSASYTLKGREIKADLLKKRALIGPPPVVFS